MTMMTRAPSVYVTRRIPPRGLELLQESKLDITQWDSDDPVPREELLKNIPGKDALFCLLTDKIDKAVIDAAGRILSADRPRLEANALFTAMICPSYVC